MRAATISLAVWLAPLCSVLLGAGCGSSDSQRDAQLTSDGGHSTQDAEAVGDGWDPMQDPELVGLLEPAPLPAHRFSSHDLIDRAEQAGEIDQTEAMRLRLHAGYAPELLPAEYASDFHPGRSSLQRAKVWLQDNWDTLDLTLQTELMDYYLRFEPIENTSGWAHITATVPGTGATPDRSLLIYYPPDDAAARAQAQTVADTFPVAYADFVALMGFPLAHDVYAWLIYPMSDEGLTWHAFANGARRGHIEIRRGLEEALTQTTTVHELFHVFQQQLGLDDNSPEVEWISEATAVWAENFVFPALNGEHRYNVPFFRDLDMNLFSTDELHEYGSYPLFLYLEQLMGPQAVVEVLENAVDPSVGVRQAVTGMDDFDHLFSQWALWNWNQAPLDYYQDEPSFPGDPRGGNAYYGRTITRDLLQDNIPVVIDALASMYQAYVFDGPLKKVVFRFDEPAAASVSRQALVRYDGRWVREDWGSLTERTFCIRPHQERAEAVVLIHATAHPTEPLTRYYAIDARGQCDPAWNGSTTVTGVHQLRESGTHLTLSGDYAEHAIVSQWTFRSDDLLEWKEGEEKLLVQEQLASYHMSRLETTTYERECGLLWERERRSATGSVINRYPAADDSFQPVRLQLLLDEDDAPYALSVRPSAGGDHDWIEERVYRAGLDRSCILDMDYHPYQDTSVHSRHNWSHDAVIIELEDLDEYSEHRFAGTVTLPGDHDGQDGVVQYVIIAFDYAFN